MKINMSCSSTGGQKTIDVEDEKILRNFYDQRIATEIDGNNMGEGFEGWVFRITGGNDKEGFPMKQGVLKQGRVKLLLSKGQSCYRARKAGERKRRSVRGCIVGPDMSIINLAVVKEGDKPIEGLNDEASMRSLRLGPKRASRIRKLLELERGDSIPKAVNMIRRKTKYKSKSGAEKEVDKAPKIQRLVTPLTLQRKRRRKAKKLAARAKASEERAAFEALMKQRQAERRASRRSSRKRSRLSKQK